MVDDKSWNFVKYIILHLCVLLCIWVLPVESAVIKKSGVSVGGSFNGAQDSNIRRLMAEKQQKLEKLELCARKVSGFKIAGISTLGLTAAGVAGNIVLANKKKTLETEIEDTQKKIESEKKKQSEIEAKIAAEESRIAEENCKKDENKKWENGKCVPKVQQIEQGEQLEQNIQVVLTEEDCAKENKVLKDGVCAEKIGEVQQPVEKNQSGETSLVLNTKCEVTDLSEGAKEGKYSESVSGNKLCLKESGATQTVKCSCAIVACDKESGYELTEDNKCKKSQEDTSPKPDHTVGEKCASKNSAAAVWTYHSKEESWTQKCLNKSGSNDIVNCYCTGKCDDGWDRDRKTGFCTVKKEEPKTESFEGRQGSKGFVSWSYSDQNKYTFGKPSKCNISSKGEWCVDLGTSIIKGTAVCTSVDYYNKEDPFKVAKNQNLTDSDRNLGTRYCWCKTSTPNRSKWLYIYNSPHGGCARNDCAYGCASYVSGDNDDNFWWLKMRSGFKSNPE